MNADQPPLEFETVAKLDAHLREEPAADRLRLPGPRPAAAHRGADGRPAHRVGVPRLPARTGRHRPRAGRQGARRAEARRHPVRSVPRQPLLGRRGSVRGLRHWPARRLRRGPGRPDLRALLRQRPLEPAEHPRVALPPAARPRHVGRAGGVDRRAPHRGDHGRPPARPRRRGVPGRRAAGTGIGARQLRGRDRRRSRRHGGRASRRVARRPARRGSRHGARHPGTRAAATPRSSPGSTPGSRSGAASTAAARR